MLHHQRIYSLPHLQWSRRRLWYRAAIPSAPGSGPEDAAADRSWHRDGVPDQIRQLLPYLALYAGN
jgi:hypothetical protein